MKRLVLILILSVAAFATTIKLDQIKAAISGIAITLPDGTLSIATPGPGLLIIPATATAPASLQVQIPTGVVQVWGADLKKLGTSYVLAVPSAGLPTSMRVYRNGLRQKAGMDYTIDGAGTITPSTPWADDDTLQVDYSR